MSIQKSYSYALIAGLGIMILALLPVGLKAAWPLMYFLVFCPGFIFGRVLVHNQSISYEKKTLFIIISGLSYILCFWIAGVVRESDEILGPLRLIAASLTGSIILSASYAVLFKASKAFYFMLSSFILAGFISAAPSAVFMYLFTTVNHYPNGFSDKFNFIEFGLMAGIFTIYPLWQITFVWVANRKGFKPVSAVTATAS